MLHPHLAATLSVAGTLALTSLPTSHQDPARLTLESGDHISLLGGTLAERMQHHGWLEARLQTRLPGLELSLRNLGFSADELTVRQRTMNFGKMPEDDLSLNLGEANYVPWDRFLARCKTDVLFAFFGYNESFAGPDGIEEFKTDLEDFIAHVAASSYNGESAPRLVLFSSIPHEDLEDPNLPDGRESNARIDLYTAATAEVAAEVGAEHGVVFVDLFHPMLARYAETREPLTINGIHLTERGNEVLSAVIEEALFGATDAEGGAEAERLESVREIVLEKNLIWFNRYRATDGYNLYGGRSRERYPRRPMDGIAIRSNYEVLQREMLILEGMAANRDARIWARARGGDLVVDDSNLPKPIDVQSNYPGPLPGGAHEFFRGDVAVDEMTAAEGMQVQLFADERRFPELVNPVQMAWDTSGRLWVATWATYPHWEPGQPMNDKLLVLEDVDGDGVADTCEAFVDDLHNPTGFEFWNGGVIVANAPDILFIEDKDGDGRADHRERLLHGLSSGDTHHGANSFVLDPGGALYFQEGTFHMSQVESIYGPVRNRNGCVWRFEPRTWRVERYIPYNFANPHGHVVDRWGQDFVTDGTGNQNYYALAFSGHTIEPQKHSGYFRFFEQRSRPAGGTEILSSAHFPDENQGNYLIGNVIGFRGIFQYKVVDDGSGFDAVEQEPIVSSNDPNFRPVDLEVGPDGALYFIDWHNPIIGHLQHHLRDPNRDAKHGRVYRVTYEGRPLSEPAKIAGEPLEVLLENLKSAEDRVRYRTRIELSGRETDEVIAATEAWVRKLDPADPEVEHHRLEALWLHQQHDRVDQPLLEALLRSDDPRARAAATRVLRYMRHRIDEPLTLLRAAARDEHPRVRLEAVVAASFFDSAEAASVALETLEAPSDKFLEYALAETMKTLEPRWREALGNAEFLSADDSIGIQYLLGRVGPEELAALPRVPEVLEAMMKRHGIAGDLRLEAATTLGERRSTSAADEVLRAIRELDHGGGAHANHVLHELGGLLIELAASETPPTRAGVVELAETGERPVTREIGYAARIVLAGSTDAAWEAAAGSHAGLLAILGSAGRLPDALRGTLYERIRPLMFYAPTGLESSESEAALGGQPTVAIYQPAPPNALLETFAALTPEGTHKAQVFELGQAPTGTSDSFGLVFRATLFAPKAGQYTFYTSSDDGSRLYIGDRTVVDNDGAHGTVERNGRIELSAGRHPITVTYFEQGGGDSLTVSWQGPGFAKEPIPESALGGPRGDSLRTAAILAMSQVPGHEDQKFQDAARLFGDGALLDPAVELISAVERGRWPTKRVAPLVETLAAFVSGLAAEERTSPGVVAALELGRELAGALPAAQAANARATLDGLGGSIVLVRTVPHTMTYDLREFWVEAGKPVAIVFQNNDVMPHNLVITVSGALESVGKAAESISGVVDPARAYIPETDEILWYTRLLNPGESQRLSFVAPETTGEHPFVCTFPGHWRNMNGVMHVVDAVDPAQHVLSRFGGESSAPAREFVKDWKLADFEAALSAGWEKGRSTENGLRMFEEAGCFKCHSFPGLAPNGGPDLTKIGEKAHGHDLLRHILEPSHEVLLGYEYHYIVLDDGTDVIGRILMENAREVHVLENLQAPEKVTVVEKDWIESRTQTKLSAMPTGLLVTLEIEEILDLLAYLQGSAELKPEHEDH